MQHKTRKCKIFMGSLFLTLARLYLLWSGDGGVGLNTPGDGGVGPDMPGEGGVGTRHARGWWCGDRTCPGTAGGESPLSFYQEQKEKPPSGV